jgi:hypothetical protein
LCEGRRRIGREGKSWSKAGRDKKQNGKLRGRVVCSQWQRALRKSW